MLNVLETFCIYHITAPGQESGAKDLPEGYVYPTMDELADQVILFQNTLKLREPGRILDTVKQTFFHAK